MLLPHNFCAGCLVFLTAIQLSQPTCVLESDLFFKINCAFKKSGLFRVRNLGGLKAHASLGFSLGDELGFDQSFTNIDPSRRRSVSFKNGQPPNLVTGTSTRPAAKQEKRGKQNRIMMRPQMPQSSRPNPSAVETLSSLHRRASSTMQPIIVAVPTIDTPRTATYTNPAPKITMAKPLPMGLPAFKPLPPKEESLSVLPIASPTRKTFTPLQIPQSKGPGLAYQSENQYPRISHDQVSKMVAQMTASHISPHQNGLLRITPHPIIVENYTPRIAMSPGQVFHVLPTTVNPFMPMPISAPPTQAAISIIPGPVFKDSVQIPLAPSMISKTPTAYSLAQNTISIHKTPTSPDRNPNSNFVDPVPLHVNDLANQLYPVYNTKKVDDYNTITGYGDDTTLKFNKDEINEKIAEIAKAGNISMEAVEAAIALRQQQLLNKFANIPLPVSTTTTTTTTTEAPLPQFQAEPEVVYTQSTQKQKRYPSTSKVMNAPKEYYPVGYEKNFDDQFQSKVDLPETPFHCGDQKYFPGLYGDENLGCMVFHVCALTDDGLVMKSFLCPESTLFDQTILKCNWWFYVDCKSTRRLYETNIPVSKSYQLMKALTFFSSYNKEIQEDGRSSNPEEMEGIKEAITILENQDNVQINANAPNVIEIITPQPAARSSESNIYRISNESRTQKHRSNRNYRNTTKPITTPKPNATTLKTINQKANDMQSSDSQIKLIKVNADINFSKSSMESNSEEILSDEENTSAKISSSKEAISKDQLHRRRRKPSYRNIRTTSTSNPLAVSAPVILNTTDRPVTLILDAPVNKPVNDTNGVPKSEESAPAKTSNDQRSEVIKETLTNQNDKVERIDATILKEGESLPPIKRFYRSSAEINSKEIAYVKNEKVQIVRPRPYSRLVGEYPTPTAAIAKLDDAVLSINNVRHKKEAQITIVTPHKYKDSKENLSST